MKRKDYIILIWGLIIAVIAPFISDILRGVKLFTSLKWIWYNIFEFKIMIWQLIIIILLLFLILTFI
ncbi:hypothetical protein, partial [Bizionia sp.]|uniref:hypothetical protein n=1 Tax=Bizionia sp. TaxID=1954480 RepID=UPI003A903F8F